MDWDTLLENGFRPFQETRLRVGLSDGGESHFRTMIRRNSRVPANHVVGAWKGNILAGFLTIVVVDGAVEIMGAFSMNDFLRVHPQDALAHFVLETFLREKGYKIASMGLSTIQTGSIVREGLHRFKAKVGFRPRPVRRVLIVHPLFRQLLRPAILAALGVSLKVLPGSRTLRKCQGALSMILNDTDLECRVRELTGGGEKSFTSRSSSEKGRSDI